MARFTLTAYPATFDGIWVSISFMMGAEDRNIIVPQEHIEAKTTADALRALEAFAAKARATGKPCSCSALLDRRDRAPNGWKKVRARIDINPAESIAAE